MKDAFTRGLPELLAELGTHPHHGLEEGRVEHSRSTYGANTFHREKPPSLARRIWEAAREPMILMLVCAWAITLGVNLMRLFTGGEADFFECAGILAAIALSVLITVAMEGRSAKAFEALNALEEDTVVKVVRSGQVQLLPQRQVVVGDLLCVETGDRLPADARLLESASLQSDESALTGESMPVSKQAGAVLEDPGLPVAERVNMLYSGSYITGGSGQAVVTAVGDGTEFGKIARELASTQRSSTPLQEKMNKLGKRITLLGATAAAVVFLAQLALFVWNGTASLDTVSEAFITSIVLIVAAVPEGLPTIVAVSLSLSVIKMSRQNALVKKMIACETVGCINVICSDKTGTLTENRMTVSQVYLPEKGLLSPGRLQAPRLLENFCMNGTAELGENSRFIGNPTECALLAAAKQAGADYRRYREEAQVVHTFPFSSEEKHMTTVVRSGEELVAYTKGSPERVLEMCGLSPAQRTAAEGEILRFQKKACRVIAFAHKAFSPVSGLEEGHGESLESGMVFDGFVAILDPLRQDVEEAVARCRRAGIELKMLTGDNLATATAIADKLHLLEGGHRAVEASELEDLSDEELAGLLAQIRVIARSTPVVKMRVVQALKAAGNVVAVTGDGVNDAPALKNADVGIAMGISGTEVSKQASDVVLLDDSFSTIVQAVQWGRGIYENFQRFIQFQLTVNLSSVIVVLASILLGFPAPFSALQLLWINIIMDGPPALTLGLEPIRQNLMDRRPTSRDASIVSGGMLGCIAVNGVFVSAIFLLQQQFNFLGAAPEQAHTVLFTLFVVFQLFNAFNSRELSHQSIFTGLMSNRLMLGVVALTFGLQVLITQLGGAFFGTVPLSWGMWGRLLATAATVVVLGELVRLARRLLGGLHCPAGAAGRSGQSRA